MNLENLNPQVNNIEQLRKNLSEKVKVILEKYKNEIKDFAFFTSSKEYNGFFKTRDLATVIYNSDYPNDYEVEGLPKEDGIQTGHAGYVLHKKMNWITFYGPLGRCLHTPDRPGNHVGITLKGEKGQKLAQELIDSITKLIHTLTPYNPYNRENIEEDLKNIAIEIIPVLEAFEKIEQDFPSTERSSIKSMIAEYKEILSK